VQNAAVFSIIDAALLRPLPFAESERRSHLRRLRW
jgi:hypothetical protein